MSLSLVLSAVTVSIGFVGLACAPFIWMLLSDWRALRRQGAPPLCLHWDKPCACYLYRRSETWLANVFGGPVNHQGAARYAAMYRSGLKQRFHDCAQAVEDAQ